jgi:hypothetical protein
LMVPNGWSEDVDRRQTDNTMEKEQGQKDKQWWTIHRKLKEKEKQWTTWTNTKSGN